MHYFLLLVLLVTGGGAQADVRSASNKAKKPSLIAPLLVEKRIVGQTWIFPSAAEEQFQLQSEGLIEALTPLLEEGALKKVEAQVDADKLISFARMRAAGILAKFDERDLSIVLEIPPELRVHGDLRIVNLAPPYGNSVGTAAFSGYLNTRSSKGYMYPVTGGASNQLPFVSSLQLVSNLHKVVLESDATYTQYENFPWRRGDVRLSTDDEKRMLRYSVGDLQYPIVGYQTFKPMAGLSVSKNFAIQPYATTRLLSRSEFLLKRPSDVEVYVNGNYVTRLHLSAGPVSLSEFPLTSGANDIEIRVTDDLGQTERLNLSFLYDPQLLGKGIQQFSYSVGTPSTPIRSSYAYDSKNYVASAFHRKGISDRYTAGISYQGMRLQNLVGLENTLLSPFGMWFMDSATSWSKGAKPALAQRIRFRSLDYSNGKAALTHFNLESEFLSARFHQLGTSTDNQYSWSFDSYISRDIPWGLGLGTGFRYQLARYSEPNRKVARVNLSRLWSSEWRSSIEYSYAREEFVEHRVFLALSWTQSTGRTYVNANFDSSTKTERVDIAHNPENPYAGVRLLGGLQNSPLSRQADLNTDYQGHRGSIFLNHQSTKDINSRMRNQDTFGLSTALVWANSSIGVSRVVGDSFVIVKPRPSVSRFEIPVNSNENYSEGIADMWGPAILPDVQSYYYLPVTIDSSRLPVGYSIGREFMVAKASYKSGVEILVGGEPTAVLKGRLRYADGKPVQLLAGTIESKKDSSVLSFFTNRKGEFWVEGVRVGTYEIHLDIKDLPPVPLKIPEGSVGIVTLPPMTVEAVSKEEDL